MDDQAPVGAFPIRQDITVLPADDPAKLRLGWVVYERMGSPVLRHSKDSDEGRQMHIGQLLRLFYEPHAITKREDLKVGDVVYIYNNMPVIVSRVDGDSAVAHNVGRNADGTIWQGTGMWLMSYEHDKNDPEPCWNSGCFISDSAFKAIDFGDGAADRSKE